MLLSGVIKLNQQTYMEFINRIKEDILNYKKNVIEQKFPNDLAELQSLKESLNRQTEDFFKENQRNMTPEMWERLNSEARESIDYVNLISSETERFIKMDQSLTQQDADVLLAQNNFIKNLSLRDELQVQMNYYEKASLKYRTGLVNQYGESAIGNAFISCTNAEGRTKLIKTDYAQEYQKLSDMKANLNKILQNDRKKLYSLYNKQAKDMPVKDLGEIKAGAIRPELQILSNEEIRKQAQLLLLNVQKLDQLPGLKEKFQFTFEGKVYQVLVPIGKKAYFENALKDLGTYRDILKGRQEIAENQKHFSQNAEGPTVIDKYDDIQIDYTMLRNLTTQQKVSYLQTIMLQIENSSSKVPIEVTDIKGNTKRIPVYYYNVYQECINIIYDLSLDLNQYNIDELSGEHKEQVYTQLMNRICSIHQSPMVVIDGRNVPAKYADKYLTLKNDLQTLMSQPLGIGMNGKDDREDDALRGYLIDESYVATLNDNLKLSYYSNLIGKASQCPIEPKVGYEAFGVKMQVPVSLLTTVQECERLTREYMEKNDLIINEMEVNARTPEMQFVYYGRIIEKMRRSSKGPKTKVEAFGESFEIPYECLDTFHECLNRINDLKRVMNISRFRNNTRNQQPRRRYQVKRVRKPFTTKVKEAFKKLSYKTKAALALGVAVASFALGYATSYHYYMATANYNQSMSHDNDIPQNITPVVEEGISSTVDQVDEKIDSWV
ncbi:MAG: hypothetical protein HFI09_05470 [Bacilli bacterium]|nr:hypothetical protein [Bacilli bacterium]